MRKFRRGMQKGGSVVHSCRLAAGSGKDGAILDGAEEMEGRRDELAQWRDRGGKCAHLGFKPG